jgi:hypothetical protein
MKRSQSVCAYCEITDCSHWSKNDEKRQSGQCHDKDKPIIALFLNQDALLVYMQIRSVSPHQHGMK